MTGTELTIRALALFSETEIEDYRELALTHINILLDETWKQNNRMRRKAGLEEMKDRLQLGGLDEQITYEAELVRQALPYGLAAKLYFDEEDNARLSMFNEEYANRLNACDAYIVESVKNTPTAATEKNPWGWN